MSTKELIYRLLEALSLIKKRTLYFWAWVPRIGDFFLIKIMKKPQSKNLVFTSAGDYASRSTWSRNSERSFDLWVVFYGKEQKSWEFFKENSDYLMRRQGSKFQNILYAYKKHKDILDQYENILVADDDIIISVKDIRCWFEIHKEYNLNLSQASFDPEGKISHSVTEHQVGNILRYTNFVEVTCPLFKKKDLFRFLDIYKGDLVGWGIDWLFSSQIHREYQGKIAVIDSLVCINPLDRAKENRREIDILQPTHLRKLNWFKFQKKKNFEMYAMKTLEVVKVNVSQ